MHMNDVGNMSEYIHEVLSIWTMEAVLDDRRHRASSETSTGHALPPTVG
jgi:hypothetical protein